MEMHRKTRYIFYLRHYFRFRTSRTYHKNEPDGLPPVVHRYQRSVVCGEECPNERETCTKSAPAARAICA